MVIEQDCDVNGQPVFPPVGLADNQFDKIQQKLLAACQLIRPPYFPVLSLEEVEGRKLTVLWAPNGQNRPYKAPEAVTANKKTWRYYIRRYSSTVEAKGETEQELLSLAARVPFDDRYNQSARIDDLSKPLMQAFLQEVYSALAADECCERPHRISVAQERGAVFFSMKHRSGSSRACRLMWSGFPKARAVIVSKKIFSRARWHG